MAKAPPLNPEEMKRLLASSLRAVGNMPTGEVLFAQSTPAITEKQATLPTPSRRSRREMKNLRGIADTLALKWRYHDSGLHTAQRPAHAVAQSIYEAAEQARVECIGAKTFEGIRKNLNAHLNRHYEEMGYTQVTHRQESHLPEVLKLMIRQALTGEKPPESAKNVVSLWQDWVEEKAGSELRSLADVERDQEQYGSILLDILQKLDIEPSQAHKNQEDEDEEPDQSSLLEDKDQQDESTTQDSGPQDTEEGDDDSSQEQEIESDVTLQELQDALSQMDLPGISSDDQDGLNFDESDASRYQIFTEQHDETIPAQDLVPDEELATLFQKLEDQVKPYESLVIRLANRLLRKLQAKQQRSWSFNEEDGLLDPARLARLITDPLSPLSYKREIDSNFQDTVITLLLDNSGSMRGRPILITAITASILARTLERCGVKTEILGFTTRSWKGGQSRDAWVSEGKPENPGRLNDLRHIIYKSADQPWRRQRRNLGLMLKEGMLKENIDGEALLWGWSRLLMRPEQRRILTVISDGAPVDDSTLSVNPPHYLDQHLKETIRMIERKSDVELLAIGIGHDVTKYYENSITLFDVADIPETLTQKLGDLL